MNKLLLSVLTEKLFKCTYRYLGLHKRSVDLDVETSTQALKLKFVCSVAKNSLNREPKVDVFNLEVKIVGQFKNSKESKKVIKEVLTMEKEPWVHGFTNSECTSWY